MSSKNIISEEDGINYTREDEKKLVKVLEDDWDNVNEYHRFVYHIINHTWGDQLASAISTNTRIYTKSKGISENISKNDKT